MPEIIDATVVNQPYDTSGNGGRKLVRLDNGWLITSNRNVSTNIIYVQVSKDNGETFTNLCSSAGTSSTGDWSIANKGNIVYIVKITGTPTVHYGSFDATTIAEGSTVLVNNAVDSGQSALGNVSLAINDAGTELHATWASKNNTYPNSFNIRYAKGTINPDGSVMWGVTEQVTKDNTTGIESNNPCIVVDKNNKPLIFAEWKNNQPTYNIHAFAKEGLNPPAGNFLWSSSIIYNVLTRAQSSPTAIFVPSEINGLPNGRIWVAWHGTDSEHAQNNIRTSYSDDGGITWSAMEKITSDNTPKHGASITANSNGEVFIVCSDTAISSGAYYGLSMFEYDEVRNRVSITDVAYNGGQAPLNPSTLFDSRFQLGFSSPLFIYRDATNSKVGFYGSWTTIEISGTDESLGAKSDTFSYAYTVADSDGTIANITEKLNGVVVNSYDNPTELSREFTVTKEQLKTLPFFKTHVMEIITTDDLGASTTRTLTFTRGAELLPEDTPLLDVVESVAELVPYFTGVKSELVDRLLTIEPNLPITHESTWQEILNVTGQINTGIDFASGTANNLPYSGTVDVTGLPFTPKAIFIFFTHSTGTGDSTGFVNKAGNWRVLAGGVQVTVKPTNNTYRLSTGFASSISNISADWIALKEVEGLV